MPKTLLQINPVVNSGSVGRGSANVSARLFYSEFLKAVQKNYDISSADCAVHHKMNGLKEYEQLVAYMREIVGKEAD